MTKKAAVSEPVTRITPPNVARLRAMHHLTADLVAAKAAQAKAVARTQGVITKIEAVIATAETATEKDYLRSIAETVTLAKDPTPPATE